MVFAIRSHSGWNGLLLYGLLLLRSSDYCDAAEYSYRWAATGPGHRAMAVNMGVANVLGQAGVVGQFAGVSTSGGASWFATQFFYSPAFFDRTVGVTPAELRDFVASWMEAYHVIVPSNASHHQATCRNIGDGLSNSSFLEEFRAVCPVLLAYGGDWVAFVSAMLNATSNSYGDAAFARRPVDATNKVEALYDTVLLLQTSLAPVYRNRTADTAVYIGSPNVSSVPIPAQYMVTRYERLFLTASDSILNTWLGPDSGSFAFDDYRDFGLYHGLNGSLSISFPAEDRGAQPHMEFDRPFRGKAPTAAQISAASSAMFGSLSGIVPSLLAQRFSEEGRHAGANVSILLETAQYLYDAKILDGLAVCTQYPRPCGDRDGMFVDGGYTDSPGLALSIGEYQSLEATDLTKTLKVLLVDSPGISIHGNSDNNNPAAGGTGSTDSWMNYFVTEHNRDVPPGGYMWPHAASAPIRSPQIFQEPLSSYNLTRLANPIPGTNHTTLSLKATTIDNSAYGVVAGQDVELLVVRIANDDRIPDVLLGSSDRIVQYGASLADLAFEIAGNLVLVQRVRDFFPVQTEAPTPSPEQQQPPSSSLDESSADDGSLPARRWIIGFHLLCLALSTVRFLC
jgi:hypothetical protein